MRYKFIFESDQDSDLHAMQTALAVLMDRSGGVGTLNLTRNVERPAPTAAPAPTNGPAPTSDVMVQPDRTTPVEEPAPKPVRGRKPKLVETKTNGEAPEPAPEPAPPADDFTDKVMLKTVGDFCQIHRGLIPEVSELLREYECSRVTELPAEKRREFLDKLESLSTPPEAA